MAINAISGAALSAVGPAIVRRAKWSWLGYGLAAYVGLRLARRYGVFGEFPNRALDMIDGTVKTAAGSVGLGSFVSGQRSAQAGTDAASMQTH